MKKIVSLFLILALCLSIFVGCGSNNASGSTSGTQSSNTTSTASAAAPSVTSTAKPQDTAKSYEPVTIKNGDRTLTFKEMPQKVFCCHLYAAENMVMLGLENYIVGKNVATNAAEVPLPELADKFKKIPEIARSHENAVAAGTDLIIGQVSAFRDTTWGTYEMFEKKGINCYTISGTIATDETIENVYEDVRFLGKVFKVEDRAEALIADIKATIHSVQAAVKNVAEKDKVRVFVMDSFNGNEIYTTSKGLQSNLIELAGGINCTRNMAEARWFNTSVETLVETNPDIIIFNDYGTQSIKDKMDFINNNPALKDIPAVKKQAYITIPLVAVMQDVRAASACKTFAKAFYPELFK